MVLDNLKPFLSSSVLSNNLQEYYENSFSLRSFHLLSVFVCDYIRKFSSLVKNMATFTRYIFEFLSRTLPVESGDKTRQYFAASFVRLM